ncbi:hypothetical protein KDL01_42585, partial [Actinospica durhamensis]
MPGATYDGGANPVEGRSAGAASRGVPVRCPPAGASPSSAAERADGVPGGTARGSADGSADGTVGRTSGGTTAGGRAGRGRLPAGAAVPA